MFNDQIAEATKDLPGRDDWINRDADDRLENSALGLVVAGCLLIGFAVVILIIKINQYYQYQ
jgi:hypothetical protein